MSEYNRREFLKTCGKGLAVTGAALLTPLLPSCAMRLVNDLRTFSGIRPSLKRGCSESNCNFPDNIPTVELHRHFEAGLSPEVIALLAQRNKISSVVSRNGRQRIENIDLQDPISISAYYKRVAGGFDSSDGFSKFLDSLGVGVGVMRTLDDLKFAAHRQILEQAEAGSIHTELRGSPYTYQENLKEQVTLVEVINAIRSGIEKAYKEQGASGAFIACFSRSKAGKYGKAVVDAVLQTHSAESPVGLDIAGAPEAAFPPSMFGNLMSPAIEAGVPITIHAGEQAKLPMFKEAPSFFVRDAILKLGARRIGHGTSILADADLRELIRKRGICLECCPVSNKVMGYLPLEQHPIKQFLDENLPVTINTDDPIPFGLSSVRDMLRQYGKILRITPQDIMQMTRNGIAAAFVTPQRRDELTNLFAAKLAV